MITQPKAYNLSNSVWQHPAGLAPGDTIGVAAPASPFDEEQFYQSAGLLRSMGYRVLIPDGLFEQTGYLAGADRHRADMLNRLFADETVRAIFCARGGYGSLRLLSLLDWKTIKQNPKIFVGCSDISVLLSSLNQICRMVVFHGPVMTSLAEADSLTIESLFSLLTSTIPLALKPDNPVVIRPGGARGRIAGGNLSTLCHLTGTPYAPSFKGRILFLEDINEPAYKIDRMLTQMKMAGFFEAVNGVVLGSFEKCAPSDEQVYEIVDAVFSPAAIPILGGVDAGHRFPNLAIPFGIEAVLDADAGSLSFLTPAVSL